jgi:hypothetical protein
LPCGRGSHDAACGRALRVDRCASRGVSWLDRLRQCVRLILKLSVLRAYRARASVNQSLCQGLIPLAEFRSWPAPLAPNRLIHLNSFAGEFEVLSQRTKVG